MSKKLTHEEWIKRLDGKDCLNHLNIIGNYTYSNTKILCRCLHCDKEIFMLPKNIVKNTSGCVDCVNRAKSKTYEEFASEVNKKLPNVELISHYIGAKKPITCKCRIHTNYVWIVKEASVLLAEKFGCRLCADEYNSQRILKTHEQFMLEFNRSKNFNKINILGQYIGALDKIKCQCKIHEEYIWYPTASSLLRGSGCQLCVNEESSKRNLCSHDEFLIKFSKTELCKTLEIIGKYKGNNKNITCRCKIHDKIFDSMPSNLLKGIKYGCYECQRGSNEMKYVEKIKYKNLKILEKYVDFNTPILHKCLICEYEFSRSPAYIVQSGVCPFCNPDNPQIIAGKNDMWTTEPNKAKYLLNPQDGYIYGRQSKKPINWKCECGTIIKDKGPADIRIYGGIMHCNACADGRSICSKFMFNILKELNIDFQTEKRFNWCEFIFKDNIRYGLYDFIINNDNVLIETDGGFHSKKMYSKSELTLEDIKFIDSEKDRLAQKNGYSVIRINCEDSDKDYIMNNIIQSDLNLMYDLSKVDFEKCYKLSCHSSMLKSCKLYNAGYSISYISYTLNLNSSTVYNYLNKGSKLNICNYKSQKDRYRIICENTREIFLSFIVPSRMYSTTVDGIKKCCEGKNSYAGIDGYGNKLIWRYYDESLHKDYKLIENTADYYHR